MDPRKDLLQQLNDGQALLLRALADLEEEQGEAKRAAGWRWLADRARWPVWVQRDEYDDAGGQLPGAWEWWGDSQALYSCSLPRLLLQHVKRLNQKQSKAGRAQAARFSSPSQALGCAATCAAHLIDLFGSVEESA